MNKIALKDRYAVIDGIPTIRQIRNGVPMPFQHEVQSQITTLEEMFADWRKANPDKVKDCWNAYVPPDLTAEFDRGDFPFDLDNY